MVSGNVPAKWDRSEVERITKASALNITVTSIRRTFSGGITHEGSLRDPDDASFEIEAFGVLNGVSLVVVEFHFHGSSREDDARPIGSFRFNTFALLGGSRSMPQLDVYFNDRDGRITRAMCEAHRDALASGEINFGLRLFKRVNDLSVSDEDLAQGYSSNSGELLGYVFRATLEATKLPKWQLPPVHQDFDASQIPSYIDFQATRANDQGFGERQKTDRLIFAIGFLALAIAFTAQNWLGTLMAIFTFIFCIGPSLRQTFRGSRGKS
jgi:hypothetical protein